MSTNNQNQFYLLITLTLHLFELSLKIHFQEIRIKVNMELILQECLYQNIYSLMSTRDPSTDFKTAIKAIHVMCRILFEVSIFGGPHQGIVYHISISIFN